MTQTIQSQTINPQNYHGFKLIEKRFVKELNAECYYFEHIKSGARLLKIANDDPNKTFSIAFKTFPESDNGAPHIMEHCVLNGSRDFPVKSPFDVLMKGSLNTFINAFTSKDFTMFPVASMNEKDYFNLMHVYLDAVFNPLIYSDPRIFKQEGWHYELMNKDSSLEYKGVVYNEMKGAYSSPERILRYEIFKNLFPDNPYGFESGGYPSAIPGLSYEDFLAFHKRYYHPENSYIVVYGNAPMDKELSYIDQAYLSHYEKAGHRATIVDQPPFKAMKDLTSSYPAMEGSPTEDQTFLAMNYVYGQNTDLVLTMSLDILCEVLVNQESAPIRLALQKAGIGQDVSASSSNYKQNVIQVVVQNANPGDKQKFSEIVKNCLQEAAEKGLNRKTVDGVINRMEFQLREGDDAQKGLTYINQALPGWFFAGDPFLGLEYEKPLATIKEGLSTGLLESTIRKAFLENPHALLISLQPEPGLDDQANAALKKKLEAYKSDLDPAIVENIARETKDLVEYQQREDSPEALATIPLLDLKDIDTKAPWYGENEKNIAGIPLLFHEEFTNKVVYTNLFFDLRVLPQEMLPYASLLSYMLGMLDTEHYSYSDLNTELNIQTGGFNTSLRTFLQNQDDEKMMPKFVVTVKAMNNKTDKMLSLTTEILNQTKFSDTARIHSLLSRLQAQLDASMKNNGFQVASKRLPSYFSKAGVLAEMTEGIDYYQFITDLTKNYSKDPQSISETLKKVASTLFTRENLIAGVTCSNGDLPGFSTAFIPFGSSFGHGGTTYQVWMLNPEKKNEGIQSASKVQYVIEGYNFKKLGYPWSGKMRVLNQVLSTDWLQTQIRVIGGAYGGFSSFSPNGNVTFSSYRDPNLKETLDNYAGTPGYLDKFEADEKTMTRYIIGTISDMDSPLTPSEKGDRAFTYYITRRTPESLQTERNDVLSTKEEDIRNYAKLVKDILDKDTYCVYGNADKISAQSNLFKHVVRLDQ